MTLNDFLIYLGGIGVIAVASWLLEDWQWYQNIEKAKIKQLVFFGFCVLIALAAQAIIKFVNPAVLAQIAPWFATVAGIFGYVFLGNKFHQETKLNKTE